MTCRRGMSSLHRPFFPLSFLSLCCLHTVVTIVAVITAPYHRHLTTRIVQTNTSTSQALRTSFPSASISSVPIQHQSIPFPSTPPTATPSIHPSTPPTTQMCIPQIDIIPTPTPTPRRRKTPLSPECRKPPNTTYVSFSPQIIYRAPPASPSRSPVPPTHHRHQPRAPATCERAAPEAEAGSLGGFVAGRDVGVREGEGKAGAGAGVGETAPSAPQAPAPAPPPPPAPPPAPPPRPQPPPSSTTSSTSSSSSSSSSSSTHSRYSLRALKNRVNKLWDRVNGLEQWRERELGRREREREREESWERRRRPWGVGEGRGMGRGRGW